MKKVSLIVILSLIMLPLLSSCKDKTEKKEEVEVETEVKMETEAPLNTLTQAEKDEGWVMLFDGETSEGWRGYKKDHDRYRENQAEIISRKLGRLLTVPYILLVRAVEKQGIKMVVILFTTSNLTILTLAWNGKSLKEVIPVFFI